MPDYELSPDAERDLFEIAVYTFEQWGTKAAERYEAALTDCLLGLATRRLRARRPLAHRPEVLVRRCKHHFVFVLLREHRPLLVLAVLHESMDLLQRLRPRLPT